MLDGLVTTDLVSLSLGVDTLYRRTQSQLRATFLKNEAKERNLRQLFERLQSWGASRGSCS